MFENKITFSTQKICKEIGVQEPVPIKLNIPDWFKKLNHSFDNKTVKGCIPFLETLTTGYLLKTDQDFFINHNFVNYETKERNTFNCPAMAEGVGPRLSSLDVNLNLSPDIGHPPIQIKGSPLLEKNKNLFIHKFMNPWIIKTPPGYSCLFTSPLNNSNDIFEIIPAIVDTDTYTLPVNFPFIVKSEKKENLQSIIKKGTPYVQIIPFKKESWKMDIEYFSDKKMLVENAKFNLLNIIHNYRNNFWKKIKWK